MGNQNASKIEAIKKAVGYLEDLYEDLEIAESRISELEIDNKGLSDRLKEAISELEELEESWTAPRDIIEEKIIQTFTAKLKKCRNAQAKYSDLLKAIEAI